MPATLGLAATLNPDLAAAYGAVIGQEARQRGKNIMLGPSLNIQRTPLCGRNFEYLGEDPFLTSRIAVNYIKGEQAQGVASCAKHFAANNQENQRELHQRADGRARFARDLSARLSRRRPGSGRAERHGRLQPVSRPALLRKRLSAQPDSQGRMGIQRPGHVRLGRRAHTDLAATNGMDMEMGSARALRRALSGQSVSGRVEVRQISRLRCWTTRFAATFT